MHMYIGCQSEGGAWGGLGEGVYQYEVDPHTGNAEAMGVAPVDDPTNLAAARRLGVLFASSHSNRFEGQPGAGITSFRIEPSGELTRIGSRRVVDPHITFATADRTERWLLVASSLGGAVSVHPLDHDGNVGEATDVHRMPGRPVVPRGETPEPSRFSHTRLPTAASDQGYRSVGYIAGEEESIGSPERVRTIPGMPILGVTSHPHAIVPDLTNKEVFVPDLSMNTVSRFAFDAGAGTLDLRERLDIGRTSAGPRLAEVAPCGDRVFVACERDSTVSVLKFVPGEEGLEETQWVSTLPAGSAVPNSGSGLALHPSGRLLYFTNRGHDSVARFAIGPEGHLTLLDTVPCEGQFPVHLSISPEGGHLVVSNLLSDSVTLFRIHPDDGSLRFLNELSSPSPTCALFW